MIRSIDADRKAGPSLTAVRPILAFSIVALVCVAADPAPGVGLATLASVPMMAAALSVTALWSWWHSAVVAVSQTHLLFVHAVSSLAHPWLILLLLGCVILVTTRGLESPR